MSVQSFHTHCCIKNNVQIQLALSNYVVCRLGLLIQDTTSITATLKLIMTTMSLPHIEYLVPCITQLIMEQAGQSDFHTIGAEAPTLGDLHHSPPHTPHFRRPC